MCEIQPQICCLIFRFSEFWQKQARTTVSRLPGRGLLVFVFFTTSLFKKTSLCSMQLPVSPRAWSGLHTNLTVKLSVGILGGSWMCNSNSVPPVTGAQDGSMCVGPARGHRQYHNSVAIELFAARSFAAAKDSSLRFSSLAAICR